MSKARQRWKRKHDLSYDEFSETVPESAVDKRGRPVSNPRQRQHQNHNDSGDHSQPVASYNSLANGPPQWYTNSLSTGHSSSSFASNNLNGSRQRCKIGGGAPSTNTFSTVEPEQISFDTTATAPNTNGATLRATHPASKRSVVLSPMQATRAGCGWVAVANPNGLQQASRDALARMRNINRRNRQYRQHQPWSQQFQSQQHDLD